MTNEISAIPSDMRKVYRRLRRWRSSHDQSPAPPGEPPSAMHPEKGLCRSAGATPPSREFGLNPRPDASQAFRPRLVYGLACYPEPALPPVGAEFFPVVSPCLSNSSPALSRGVLIVDLKFG